MSWIGVCFLSVSLVLLWILFGVIVIPGISNDSRLFRQDSRTASKSESKKHEGVFEEHDESNFLFIDDPPIAPTNNAAEQNIRTLVMDRIVTQGTRSDMGNEWHERFRTTRLPSAENRVATPWHFSKMRS